MPSLAAKYAFLEVTKTGGLQEERQMLDPALIEDGGRGARGGVMVQQVILAMNLSALHSI